MRLTSAIWSRVLRPGSSHAKNTHAIVQVKMPVACFEETQFVARESVGRCLYTGLVAVVKRWVLAPVSERDPARPSERWKLRVRRPVVVGQAGRSCNEETCRKHEDLHAAHFWLARFCSRFSFSFRETEIISVPQRLWIWCRGASRSSSSPASSVAWHVCAL